MNDEPVSPSTAAVAAFNPTAPLTIEPPNGIFEGHEVPEFLRALYDHGGLCGSVLRTVASYGTAARFWTPAKPRELTIEQMLDASERVDTPYDRWCAWVFSLSTEAIDALGAEALAYSDGIYDAALTAENAAEAIEDTVELETIVDAILLPQSRRDTRALMANVRAINERIVAARALFAQYDVAETIAGSELLRAKAWQEPYSVVGGVVSEAMQSVR